MTRDDGAPTDPAPTEAVGVVLPVHDEERLLAPCLEALGIAVARAARSGPSCRVVVVLDACGDGSRQLVQSWRRRLAATGAPFRAVVVDCSARRVGAARRLGCTTLLDGWERRDPTRIWLATTDADSRVPPDWLTAQLSWRAAGADLWSGRVGVADWALRAPGTDRAWHEQYATEAAPVHGASLGVSASAYLAAGGFAPLATGEDRALHDAVVAAAGRVVHDRQAPVLTSSRRLARAPAGFGAALDDLEAGLGAAG